MTATTTTNLDELAQHLRTELKQKKFLLLYAYNGTGKTRLSMAFKNEGKKVSQKNYDHGAVESIETITQDTLYFNAFTEDLFNWDNDLENDSERVLKINKDSRFFAGLDQLEMDNRIRPLLARYADFDFRIDTTEWTVTFSREVDVNGGALIAEHIKVSRGEENIFIWCFFLAIVELAMDSEIEAYRWVKYVYIDDPISSLDEHNAITVGHHLAQLLKKEDSKLKTVISTHHTLFFNVLCNELKNAKRFFLSKGAGGVGYVLREEKSDTPFFHHVAALTELYQAAQEDRLFTHHFNMLRTILEKTASFHGHKNFSACIKQAEDDSDGILHTRLINIMSHGNYSLFEPQQMLDENKAHFKRILNEFLVRYAFNPDLFPPATEPKAGA
jgi:wobble nucleotide-excising tRNase